MGVDKCAHCGDQGYVFFFPSCFVSLEASMSCIKIQSSMACSTPCI